VNQIKATKPAKIAVIGSGSWGTAIAHHLSVCGNEVVLWSRDETLVRHVEENHENAKYLPGISLHPQLRVSNDLKDVMKRAEMIVCSIPTQQIRKVFSIPSRELDSKIVVNTSKGLEIGSYLRVSEIFGELCPTAKYAVLSGPSFAVEVARKLPTAVTVAAVSLELAETVQRTFSNSYFRVYTSQDVVGVEIAGAMKNVIAIAAGIVSGLRLGYNAQAALINRGIAEIARLGVSQGAELLTFLGLAGMGDLVLTCTGPLSRNLRFGEGLGKGMTIDEIQKNLGGVAEGYYTAQSAFEFGRKVGVELPITEQIYSIIYESKTPGKAVTELMSRDLKEEWAEVGSSGNRTQI
jgi:glycerol-3-phosphate dehydrogenase (NAD(P)+)